MVLTLAALYLCALGLSAALIYNDWRYFTLPDVLVGPLLAVGLVVADLAHPGAAQSILGLLFTGASMFVLNFGWHVITGRPACFPGDMKLAIAAGAWVGISAIPAFFLTTGALALITVRLRADRRLPLGPAIIGAAGLCHALLGLPSFVRLVDVVSGNFAFY